MGKTFFVVHDSDSFDKHPNLIGFHVKTDLNGQPLRGKENKLIPENPTVNEIMPGDKIVYYTRGDTL